MVRLREGEVLPQDGTKYLSRLEGGTGAGVEGPPWRRGLALAKEGEYMDAQVSGVWGCRDRWVRSQTGEACLMVFSVKLEIKPFADFKKKGWGAQSTEYRVQLWESLRTSGIGWIG